MLKTLIMGNNIGKVINDFYCNGYAGRRYDLSESKIEGEGHDWIVVRIKTGEVAFMSFDNSKEKQGSINKWCDETADED